MAEDQAQSLLSSHHPRIPRKPLSDRSLREDMRGKIEKTVERELYTEPEPVNGRISWRGVAVFCSLFSTTAVSSALLAGDDRGWVLSSSLYDVVTNNRASVQIIIQLLANILGLCQVTALCTLINRGTRLHFSRTKASMDDLQFWSHLCSQSMSWQLPFRYLLPLLAFLGLTVFPSALWAGALSPIDVLKSQISTIMIPSYTNTSLIREYPSEFPNPNQTNEVRNTKGTFTYRVGITMEGALLSSASSATTVDGSPRRHTKLDNSGFAYLGRSYGIGAPVGLTDTSILQDNFAMSYTYQERGLNPEVQCIYNSSSQFLLSYDGSILFEARGPLPNSNGFGEDSTYIGHGAESIVAIGVAAVQTNGTQYMAIASGSNYASLNTAQCSINYIPTLFNISVDTKAKNISVLPVSATEDINPAGNIVHATTRQLELISNDQTNLYQSLLGNSFMASIADYNISQTNSSTPITEATSTLVGLTNSVSAMLDDILVGYASAQLMVGNQSTTTEVVITTLKLKLGQRVYIYAIFVVNLVVVMLVLEEVIRTRLWKGLVKWDYMDIGEVIISSLKAGKNIADGLGQEMKDGNPRFGLKVSKSGPKFEDISGKALMRLDRDTGALLLDGGNEDLLRTQGFF